MLSDTFQFPCILNMLDFRIKNYNLLISNYWLVLINKQFFIANYFLTLNIFQNKNAELYELIAINNFSYKLALETLLQRFY